MRRRVKQLVYGMGYLLAWGIVLTGAYFAFFRAEPTCFDAKQNGTEEGIDCGGACFRACIPTDLSPLELVGEPRVFRPTADLVYAVAQIRNSNPGHAAPRVRYAFTLAHADGASSTVSGETFIYAGDVKYLLGFAAAASRPVRALLAAAPAAWVPADTFSEPELRVQDHVTASDAAGIRVDGSVANDDALTLLDATVIALFYGERGELLGASQTILPRIPAGAVQPFFIAHPPLSGIDVERTQVAISARRP